MVLLHSVQYGAEVLWNKATPDLQGKKEPLSYKHASKLRPKHSLRPYTKKKLTQNKYLISLWSAKFISGARSVLSNLHY